MASAADSYLVQTSMMKEDETPDFTSKQWTFINDINQGNYGNRQVQFDMSGFFNAARFMSFSEMILVLPLVTTLSPLDLFTDANPTGSTTAALNGLGPNLAQATSSYIPKPNNLYSVGFKSGYWNLIYSMSVNADGVDVVQLQPNLNYLCSAKAMMEWSQSDVDKHGPLCGFLPDDELSWGINATQCGNENGFGVYNNTLPPEQKQIAYSGGPANTGGGGAGTSSSGILNSSTPHVNRGLYERMLKTSTYVVPLVPAIGATVYDSKYTGKDQGSLASAFTTSLADTVFPVAASTNSQNSAISDNAVGTSARVWITTAYIRLKDVCDFFSKLPLCRSLNLKLIINLNTGHLSVRQPNFLSSYVGAPQSGSFALHPLDAAAGTFNMALSGATRTLSSLFTGNATAASITYAQGAGAVDTLKLPASSNTHVNAATGATLNDFGYGQITDNSFQNTCPLMLAKCVSSVLTNVAAAVQVATPAATQNVEQDLYPGVNCGLYSQYRSGLALSIAIAAPDSGYHNVTGLSSYTHPLKSCRIYVPSVEMVPSKAIRYLENHKQQMVVYDDFYTFTYNGIASGGQFNYMAANNIANAKYLIVLPFYHDDSVGSVASANNVIQTRGDMAPQNWNMNCSRMPFEPISPFDSAPATTAPGAMISRYNVLLSNQTVYQRDREYDFETFLEEVEELGAINGGLDTGLTSGLIDFRKWSNNYRYYVTNLARRLEGDNTPKSITLQGINSSAYTMDLQIFVIYSKKVSLDCGTGRVSV